MNNILISNFYDKNKCPNCNINIYNNRYLCSCEYQYNFYKDSIFITINNIRISISPNYESNDYKIIVLCIENTISFNIEPNKTIQDLIEQIETYMVFQ